MPEQPSKESLERARRWLYQSKNKYPAGRADDSLALEFDAIAKELRQQNAALVSALREIDDWLYRLRGMCFSGAKSPSQMREIVQKALAPYAPAETKEKP